MSEEIAIYFFRQMISAIAYCHSFNVCHRDLKPENILITADLQLKIADFGMAALHQTSTHHLATACGSPHYAAPELLKNRQYRGDRADIWSMGVILYAMLSATLPFDDPDLRVMMNKTKKGFYEMPKGLTPEAEDLIRRMLQTNPDRRITLQEIWRHPLVQKYSYIDNFGDLTGQLPETRKGFRYSPVPQNDIDPQLLRQLRSMWHMFSEQDLTHKLTSDEPNDQKAFYWLLHNYRDKQLEDFKPELSHSMSDYHHLKPSIWKKRVSTCEFAQPRANGHGRSISRFTVISNVAENDADTIVSYDPYRGSGRLKSMDSQVSHAKVIVHRDGMPPGPNGSHTRLRSGSNAASRRARANSAKGGRPPSSRGSMSSLRSARQGTPQARPVPTLRHKRAVDFSHLRKRSNSTGKLGTPARRNNGSSHAVTGSSSRKMQRVRSLTPEMPKVPDGARHPKAQGAPFAKNASTLFREELRHFSNDIARNCDEAFRSSLIEDDSELTENDKKTRDSTPLSFTIDSPSTATDATEFSHKSWLQRPLPPLPADGFDSLAPTATNSRPSSGECDSGSEYVIESATAQSVRQVDRRIVSAPTYNQTIRKGPALPSINENAGTSNVHGDKSRIVSAPPYASGRKANGMNGSMEYLSKAEQTIRVVAPSDDSPMPQPLNIKKKVTKEEIGRKLHLEIAPNNNSVDGPLSATSEPPSAGIRKMRSWFRRPSRADTETSGSDSHEQTSPSGSNESNEPESATTATSDGSFRKKAFTLPFWKNSRNRDSNSIAEGDEEAENQEPQQRRQSTKSTKSTAVAKKSGGDLRESQSNGQRNIEVKQNWLTRLFRVKPATSYICMALSRRRARQEVAILLREWRRYGIKDIQVDKQRNIIFARVAAKNCKWLVP